MDQPRELPATPGADDAAPAICPRCQRAFRCGAASAAPCACTGLVLPSPLLASLRQRYPGCLCLDCLRALGGQPPAPDAPAAP
ncbi:MAG: cysteine-rich CWC family protein [Burkholderiales bacterium]|nr:cysteine-rich CWC family protein [Burkholderiales bacterium]